MSKLKYLGKVSVFPSCYIEEIVLKYCSSFIYLIYRWKEIGKELRIRRNERKEREDNNNNDNNGWKEGAHLERDAELPERGVRGRASSRRGQRRGTPESGDRHLLHSARVETLHTGCDQESSLAHGRGEQQEGDREREEQQGGLGGV